MILGARYEEEESLSVIENGNVNPTWGPDSTVLSSLGGNPLPIHPESPSLDDREENRIHDGKRTQTWRRLATQTNEP